jgi:hypothetical protein
MDHEEEIKKIYKDYDLYYKLYKREKQLRAKAEYKLNRIKEYIDNVPDYGYMYNYDQDILDIINE